MKAPESASNGERQRAEHNLRRVEEYLAEGQRLSHTGSWAWNVGSGEMSWSHELYLIYGLDPGTNVTYPDVLKHIHPEDRPRVQQVLEDAVRASAEYELAYRIVRADGTIRHVNNLAHPGFDEAGVLVEYVGTTIDTTERVQLEEQLIHAYDEIKLLRDRLAEEKLYLEGEIRTDRGFEEIVGKSAPLKHILKEVQNVAPTESAVLILGETGTGKELVARAIHQLSSRRHRTFVKIDCAAIHSGLLESELFGHEKGAFTGAIAKRIGRFELADGGSIFLDEVGELPLELQSKLLRVLQEQEIEPVGSVRTIRVNVRLIAATNRNLEQMVADKVFRSDLYYRLHIFPIMVPPLRKRSEDIPELVQHFTLKHARAMNKSITSIPSASMEALCRYHWPGNVRELENFIERSVILSHGSVLDVPLGELKHAATEPVASGTLKDVERDYIRQTLEECNWVIGGPLGAAARLGVKRTSLQYRMQKLGITRPRR